MPARRKRPPFEWLARDMLAKIDRQGLHRTQQLPGMTPDEVRAEMLEALWRAWQTYSASTGVPIEKYFWRVWINRKSDLISFYYAQRRDLSKEWKLGEEWWAHCEESWAAPDTAVIPEAPTADTTAREMWRLLAQGYTRQDVLSLLDITKRTYYEIIDEWRGKGVAIILG